MNRKQTVDVHSAIDVLSQTAPLADSERQSEPDSAPTRTDSTLVSGNGSARFQVKKQLGTGAFGTVSLAWDATLKRDVAIKKPANTADFRAKQTFLIEAQLAARIKHPGVVVVHDFGLDEAGEPYVVYEYLCGQNLRDRIAVGSFELRDVLELAISVADALVAVHKVGLTHRDLKPANILLDEQGHPHIADFGLAVSEEMQMDHYGEVVGTYRYMAPEQVRGETNLVDGRTDLWALGVIMYQVLTGHYPFPGESKSQISEQVLYQDPRPLRQWNSSIPKRVEEIVLSLLAKPKEKRPSSASDLLHDLQVCRDRLQESPSIPARPMTVSLARLAAVAGLVIVVGLAFVGFPFPSTGTPSSTGKLGLTPARERAATEFPADIWTPLLRAEPAPLIINAEDQVTFHQGEVFIDARYQVVLRLGEIREPDYSLRITVEPDRWNAQAGLFLGWQPALKQDDTVQATFLGVRQSGVNYSILPRLLHFQSAGKQLPVFVQTIPGVEQRPAVEDAIAAEIHVEVQAGRISKLFLNSQELSTRASQVSEASAVGVVGIYVLEGKCRFSKAQVRVSKQGN